MSNPELTPLLKAIRSDDIKQVKKLIPITRVDDTHTRLLALLEAVERKNTTIADFLLRRGICNNREQRMLALNYFLQRAYRNGSRQMLELLLSHGADPFFSGDPSTCYKGLCKELQPKTDMNLKLTNDSMYFLNHGPDPYSDEVLLSPIGDAVSRLDTDMIRLMLDLGDRRLTSNRKRYRAMFAAYTISYDNKVKTLAKRCMDEDRYFIDIKLRETVRLGEVKHVKMLLPFAKYINAGIPRKVQVANGYNDLTISKTPLEVAVEQRHTGMCDLLLQNGADINITMEFGRPLLTSMTLCYADDDDDAYSRMFSYLLSNGADPNLPDTFGNTPLHFEVSKRNEVNISNVKKLLQYGADVNHRNDWEESPMSILTKNPLIDYTHGYDTHVESISVLLWAGVDLGGVLSTSYSYEVSRGCTGCVRLKRCRLRGTRNIPIAQRVRLRDDQCITCLFRLIEDIGGVGPAYSLKLVRSLVMTGSLLRSEISHLYHTLNEGGFGECDSTKEFLEDFLSNGYTLKELCRLKLREAIQPPLWVNLTSGRTRLPKPLVGYLLDYTYLQEQD